jgi:hypothetical protein
LSAQTSRRASELAAVERRRLELLGALNGAGESLPAFIRRVNPTKPPPRHILPVLAAIQRARHARIKLCISMPPRHAKTVSALHALAWWLRSAPSDLCAYFTYSETRARSKSRFCRMIAERAGVALSADMANAGEWRTKADGGLVAGGVGSGLSGVGIAGVMIVDDAYKSREEADSELVREKIWEWFNDVPVTRLEGGSLVVIQTRWHRDDLIGRLSEDPEWRVISLPALADEDDPLGRAPGEALWPERFSADELGAIRRQIGEFSWASLYQGRPRPRGAKLFGPAHYYDQPTTSLSGYRGIIAADPAASEKTSADYSAAVALAVRGYGP